MGGGDGCGDVSWSGVLGQEDVHVAGFFFLAQGSTWGWLFASMLWCLSLSFLLSAVTLYPNFLEVTPFRYIENYFCLLFLTPISSFVQVHVCVSLSDLGTIVCLHCQASAASHIFHICTPLYCVLSPLPKAFANIPALHLFIVHYHNRVVKPGWLCAMTKKTKSATAGWSIRKNAVAAKANVTKLQTGQGMLGKGKPWQASVQSPGKLATKPVAHH